MVGFLFGSDFQKFTLAPDPCSVFTVELCKIASKRSIRDENNFLDLIQGVRAFHELLSGLYKQYLTYQHIDLKIGGHNKLNMKNKLQKKIVAQAYWLSVGGTVFLFIFLDPRRNHVSKFRSRPKKF